MSCNKKINSHLISNFKFVHALPLFVDDPKECESVDCNKDGVVDHCPKTCSPINKPAQESEVCKLVDCSKPNSAQNCPVSCPTSTKGNHFCRTINI